MRGYFQAIPPFVSASVVEFPMSGWVCQWKTFWIPVGVLGYDSSCGEQCMANIPTMVQGAGYKDYTTKQKLPEEAPSTPRQAGQPDALPWEPLGPQGTAYFWKRTEAPLPLLRPKCNFIHQGSSILFLKA